MKYSFAAKKLSSALLAGLSVLVLLPCFAQAATFTVNDNGIASDANAGDGICEVSAATGDCSLMAAIEEAAALTGAHTIIIDATVGFIPSYAAYDLSGADITLQGPGRDLLTFTVGSLVTSANDSISGLSILIGDGAITLDDNVTLADSKLYFTSAPGTGTLVKNANGSATIDGSELTAALTSAGGSITTETGSSLTISDSTITGINNYLGSNLINASGALIISDTVFSDNGSSSAGVAIAAGAALTISNTVFTANSTNGAISVGGPALTISDSTFSNNTMSSRVIYNGANTAVITNSHFTGNDSAIIFADSSTASLTISGSVFANNSTVFVNPFGVGEGFSAVDFSSTGGVLTIRNSSFTGDSSVNSLGSIRSFGTDILINVTISDNQTDHNLSTVAAYTHEANGSLPATIINSTISHNVNLGTGTSGIYVTGDSFSSKNSIFADNSNMNGASDIVGGGGPNLSLGYNVVGTGTSSTLLLIDSDSSGSAMLGALTVDANTGLSFRAPLAGSPALDMGENGGTCTDNFGATVATDMLGNPRPVDGDFDGTAACDIGAIEYQPDATPASFAFSAQTDVAVSTLLTSNTITVSDIEIATAISISNGEYRINAGDFTSANGFVSNNDTVMVQHTSDAANLTTTDTVLSIGGVSANFSSTTVAAEDHDGDGTPNSADTDDDNDGVLDDNDAFPFDDTESLDTDGDTIGNNADTDDDADGVTDNNDAFPLDAAESIDTDADGTGNNADTDDDNDGALDGSDAFPLDATESLDTDGDTIGNNTDTDDDGDGVADNNDAFPLNAAETIDSDGDGAGDNADSDDDNDGVGDAFDAFPLDAGEQYDTDADGVGNNADTDDDGDGIDDVNDAFPLGSSESIDTDGDGISDNNDSDDDNDGVADGNDAFPLDGSETIDTDADGVGNNADTDDDGDAVEDKNDDFPLDATESVDSDGNGIGDNADAKPAVSSDDDGGGGGGGGAMGLWMFVLLLPALMRRKIGVK